MSCPALGWWLRVLLVISVTVWKTRWFKWIKDGQAVCLDKLLCIGENAHLAASLGLSGLLGVAKARSSVFQKCSFWSQPQLVPGLNPYSPYCKLLVPPAPSHRASLQSRLLRDHIANINGQIVELGSHWTAKETKLFQLIIMVKAAAACIQVEMAP